jgi:GT2 family glycosyltransferase
VAGGYTVLLPDGTDSSEPAPGAWMTLLVEGCYFPEFYRAALDQVPFSTCAMLIKKEVILAAGGFDPLLKTGEDRDLWYRIADQHPAIGFVQQPLFIYDRQSDGSLTRGAIVSHSADLWRLLQKHVPATDGPRPWTRSTKARFLRHEINRTLQHAVRLGERDNVRRLLFAYGEWVTLRNRALARVMSVVPQSLWYRLSVYWRRLYDPAQERRRIHAGGPSLQSRKLNGRNSKD